MNRRVVISGVGILTSIGVGKAAFWKSAIAGKSNLTEIDDRELTNLKGMMGCVLQNSDCHGFMGRNSESIRNRGSLMAIEAARQALEDGGLPLQSMDPGKIGVVLGTTLGESPMLEHIAGWLQSSEFTSDKNVGGIKQWSPSSLASNVSLEFGFNGPSLLIPTACAAGNCAITYAYDAISSGSADVMLAGGVEPFSKILLVGFARMKILSPDYCRPFDKNRKGLLVGEGAGIIMLEEYQNARRRSAPIYAEITGYGLSADAYHMAAPDPSGKGAALALSNALKSAGVVPEEIQYISAHGTGTPANDLSETLAVKKIFKDHAYRVPISSIKSMIGHTMGAASGIEAVLCALIMKNGVIPPTINYTTPDPLCDLDYVPNVARDISVKRIVSNSYGFYGQNASIVIASL